MARLRIDPQGHRLQRAGLGQAAQEDRAEPLVVVMEVARAEQPAALKKGIVFAQGAFGQHARRPRQVVRPKDRPVRDQHQHVDYARR